MKNVWSFILVIFVCVNNGIIARITELRITKEETYYFDDEFQCVNLTADNNHSFEMDANYDHWNLVATTDEDDGPQKCTTIELRNNGNGTQIGTFTFNNTRDGKNKAAYKVDAKNESKGQGLYNYDDGKLLCIERHTVLYARYDKGNELQVVYYCGARYQSNRLDPEFEQGIDVYSTKTKLSNQDWDIINSVLRRNNIENYINKFKEIVFDDQCLYS